MIARFYSLHLLHCCHHHFVVSSSLCFVFSVLINVSEALKDSFKRDEDLVFRLGGEEFGILMHVKTVEDAIQLTDDARQNIQNLAIKHEKNPPGCVTASFGLIVIPSSSN